MRQQRADIYGGKDPRDLAMYSVQEAARYLRIPAATLRSWVVGRRYPRGARLVRFRPLIRTPDSSRPLLSFNNMVEAHVLRALRTEHGVSVKHVRLSLEFAQKRLDIKSLLLSHRLSTGAGDLFLERYGELINLNRSGQLAMKKVLEAHLQRIEWDSSSLPRRLFPMLRTDKKVIVIDPRISFGRPVIQRRGISTAAIVERIDAGESVEALVEDYDIEPWEVEEALIYEKAA